MGTLKGRGAGSRELVCLTPLLDQAKEMLQVRHTGQHTSRCKGLLLQDDSDHRRMHIVEQVRGKVRGSEQVSNRQNLRSCLVHWHQLSPAHAGVYSVAAFSTARSWLGFSGRPHHNL